MDDDAVVRFRRAYWSVMNQLETVRLQQWERSQVTLPQLRVLFHVRRVPDITTGELSRALGITVSTTSGLVIKLVERGLVERHTTPEDRRQAPLRLTEAGQALVGELSDVGRPFLALVAERLGDDLARVTATLERLAQTAVTVRSEERLPELDAAPAAARAGDRSR
jgi:DNA-binding MarR family transcriptional regulator